MKNKLLSILLGLCMVVTLMPAAAWADVDVNSYENPEAGGGVPAAQGTGDEHSHYLCCEENCNEVGGHSENGKTNFDTEIKMENDVLYKGGENWTASNESYELAEGEYYLSTDITLNEKIVISGNVTLCLNGHSITKNGNTSEVIDVHDGNLTLTDCKDDSSDGSYGKITHGSDSNGRGVYIGNSGAFNMYGGNITGNNTASGKGGGVYMDTGTTFNMYGGTITGNTASASSNVNGGGVYVDNGTFNMYGGTITGNTAYASNNGNGGGVYVYNGTFSMSSGSISGNNAKIYGGGVYVYNGTVSMSGSSSITGNNAGNGGGVFVNAPNNGTFSMSGSSIISGNNAKIYGGGVYVYDGTFTVSGAANITDNVKNGTKDTDGNYTGSGKNNVCLYPQKTITIGEGGLANGAKIGVTLYSGYGDNSFTSGWKNKMANANPTDYFTSDDSTKKAVLDGDELKLGPSHTDHYLCGGDTCTKVGHDKEEGTTTFTAWSSKTELPSDNGKYYLTNDVVLGSPWAPADGVVLCLNGHTITGPGGDNAINVKSGEELTLTDCAKDKVGKVTHAENITGRGVYVYGGRFTMYGGSIGDNGGSGVYVYSGSFTMNGGSITGNTDRIYGGGVYVGGSGSTFTMNDGSIGGNNAKDGGGVYVSGSSTGNVNKFIMNDGNITGNTATTNGGGVCVNGGTFTMAGGSITGNKATAGGGVYRGGTFTVSKAVIIKDNVNGDSNPNNVYLPMNTTITIGSGGLTKGAEIGVTTWSKDYDTVNIANNADEKKLADYKKIFSMDKSKSGYDFTVNNKKLTYGPHQHSWNYTLKENPADTITATCKDCSASGGTLTINAPDAGDLTYNGSAKAATVTTSDDWEGENKENIIVNYIKQGESTSSNTAPKNAGKYTASIKLGDAEASVTYTIAKATPTVNWQGYSYNKRFTGSAIANPTSSDIQIHDGKNNTLSLWDSVTFKWYKATKDANGTYTKADNNALEANPIDAGDYIIAAVFTATDNTNAATVEKGLTIAKAQDIGSGKSISKEVEVILTSAQREYVVDLDKLLKENNINYGGDLAVNTNYLGITVGSTWADSAALEGNTLKITMKSLTGANAGVLGKITANLTSKNYNVIPFEFNLKAVAKPEKTLDVTMDGWTYGNTANSPVYDKPQNTTETTVTYTRKDGTAVTGVPTDAGEYKVTVKCETDTEVYIGTTDFEIAKRKVNISGFTGVDKVYDGTTNASVNCDNIVFANKLNGDELTFTVNQAHFSSANVGDKKTITFGNGYTFGGASAANYEIGTLQNSMPAKITKKEITFAYGHVGIKKYDGTVTARIFEPKIEGLVGEEKLTSGTDYTVSAVFDSADVGDKNVTITVILNDTEATSNYQWKDGKESYVENTTLKDGIYKGDGGKFGSADGTAELTLRYTDTTEHRYKIDTSLLPKGQNWTLAPTSGKVHCWIDSTTNELVYKNSTGKAGETFDATITAQCSNYNNWTHNVTIRLTDRDEQTGFAFEDNTSSVIKTYGDADFTVKASGQVTGSTVTYSSSDENVAIVDNTGKVTIIGAGTAIISATASETTDYAEKTVSCTLTVNKKQITAPTADSTAFTYNGKEQTYKLTEDDAHTITGNKQTNADESGYAVTVALKDKQNTKWAGEGDDTVDKTYSFVIKKATVTIAAKNQTEYVGKTAPTLGEDSYTVSGLFGEDKLTTNPTIKYVDAEGNEITPDMTKTGETIIRVSGAAASENYTISYIDGKLTVSAAPSGGGSTIQKPTIIADAGADTKLSYNGRTLTIAAEEGYEITDVLVNSVSKGKVTEVTGLRTGDKVEVKAAKKAEPTDPAADKNAKLIKGVGDTSIILKSKLTKAGKVLLTWTKSKGYKVDYFEVYRSVKKNSGYGKKPFFTTKDGNWSKYLNTKELKAGKTYYYKVRGVRVIDGEKYYTEYSNKAWRTIK